MATVDASACPACKAPPGSLRLTGGLQARPLGSFSLAGAQMKVSARSVPVLTCTACPMRLVGEFDRDGCHVTFPAGRTRDAVAH